MIKKDYDELYHCANTITAESSYLFQVLYKILQADNKNFTIEFKGKKFDFHPATTRGEEKALKRRRKKFIKLLLKYVTTNMIKQLDKECTEDTISNIWEPELAFAQGVDPETVQLSKEDLDAFKEHQKEEDKEFGKKRPLDKEAYQVKMQDQKEKHEFVE